MIRSPSFRLFDHQGSQIFGRNEKRLHVVDRVDVDERWLAGQLSHFGDELTRSLLHDRGAVPKGSRRVTRTEPLISTNMPGAVSPVTNSASPGA